MAIPIPQRTAGYRLGSAEAPVQVEAFVDVECPFSKKAWPTLLAIANSYSELEVGITAHAIVLCDHRQSWDITKAAVFVAEDDPVRFWQFLSLVYKRQEDYAGDRFDQRTRLDLYHLLGEFVAEFDSIEQTNLMTALRSDRVEKATKASIRYAISRGIWSTPTFLVNGAEATDLSSASTIADWRSMLELLL
jgi:protein-disulfide isomerase